MKAVRFLMLSVMLLLTVQWVAAQDDKIMTEIEEEREDRQPKLNFGADIFSRYVWRGYDYGNSPAIQPNISFSWNGLNVGAWGSYAFSKHSIQVNDSTIVDAGNYSEADLYISYTYKWFTILFMDYFALNGLNPNEGNQYFDYNNATTGHTIEGLLMFDGTENFRLTVMASTLLYGADKGKDSTGTYGMGTSNNFSTYFEVGYVFDFRKIGMQLKPYVGGIPFGSSWYGPHAGIINIGVLAKKEIKLSSTYGLPVQASLVTNPMSQSVFLVFGISL
jgi:hypothetical protein